MPSLMPPLTDAQQLLVTANQRLAYWVVNGLRRSRGIYRRADPDALYSAALLGLCVAATRFNPHHGVKFVTFAYFWCRCYAQAESRQAGVITLPGAATSRNGMSDATRQQARQAARTTSIGNERAEHHDPDACHLSRPEPCQIELAERRDQVEQMLSCLNSRDRQLVERRIFEGWTLKEIGDDMGISKERVRQLQRRAFLRIRAGKGST